MSERLDSEFVFAGDLILDEPRREVWIGDEEVHLTKKECRLLWVFMTHPGKVLSHKVLMQGVWDTDFLDDIRILYAYIHRLRRKMEEVGGGFIYTVRGVGYRFMPPELISPVVK